MRTYPVTYQHGTPTTSTHRPPSTALAQHTRAPQAPHTLPPACACHQTPSPHAAVCRQVPPTASHRMSPLRSPAATTDSAALQPRPLGLPGSRAPPHPLPPLRGPQPPPPRAARGPSRTPPRQPPQLLRVPHRHPPGPPGRVPRGGRGGPRMDHSRGHGQHTPTPPQPPFGCGALWAPSSTRAVAPQPVQPAPVAPRAGKHSLRPVAPPPARGTPSAVGSRTQPAWQHHLCLRQSRSAGLTPVVPRTTAFPCQQAVVEWLGSMS